MIYRTKLILSILLFVFSIAVYANDIQPTKEPVLIGLDGEFGYLGSTSAEAISSGIQIAINEINLAGGVLDGRPLKLVEKANHSVPARSIHNIKKFAEYTDLVAIFCGRFSPTVLEALPTLKTAKIPLLNPWAAADAIVDNGSTPNYAFRLSLSDGWAMPTMIRYAESKGAKRLGMLLLNTSWGRGNLLTAERYVENNPTLKIVHKHWFNWDDKSLLDKYEALLQAGAEAVLLVSNADEAAILIKEMVSLPPEKQLPIVAHWGVTGGVLPEMAGSALHKVDFSVVQTYSFINAARPKSKTVVAAAQDIFNVSGARELPSPTGIAHAYDLTHILALAINLAGSTERLAIRDALEQVINYDGLIKFYKQPFSPENHDALSPEDVFMAKYDNKDNAIVRIWPLIK
ncbi:ABC transporter substrate-binding protein [Shewanella sp. ULN5]|uniref:ABC transporter substrate-binding protein n=1 Tax=Shewanella sp. ULN5 TaxID=2994678 RepID=UPI00273FAFCA|nr:ABC transporter substrate-binding protein [Shewanella sp. ULN5]MDP5145264.1 ABC transporter substrate-binding protein [Shewanella sp. ULN5]